LEQKLAKMKSKGFLSKNGKKLKKKKVLEPKIGQK